MRTSRALLSLLTLLPVGTALPSWSAEVPPCAPGIGIGLVEVPAGASDPRARTYVVDHVKPGARFSRAVEVCNGTDRVLTVALYAGAAEVRNGTFTLGAGHARNELTSWVRIEPASLRLLPHGRARARATFDVPRVTTAGERYGVLLAELPPAAATPGIPIGSRVGVRVYLDVGPGGAPKSDFGVDSMQASRSADGKGQVTAQVHNTGKRALDITGSLLLREGPGGQSGGPYPARLGTTLAAGETEPVIVPIDAAIADGPWTAQLTLSAGLVVRRVRAALTFPTVPGTSAGPVDVEKLPAVADNEVRPGRSLAVVLLVLGAVVGLAALSRRRRRIADVRNRA